MAAVATEFERIIHSARERKKNEALADKIFSKGRRQSALTKLRSTPGGSLASRVGVKKPQQQQRAPVVFQNRRASVPAGNVDGEWTHDLHSTVNGNGNGNGNGSTTDGSLRSRMTTSSSSSSLPRTAAGAKRRAARLSAALDRMDTAHEPQVNVVDKLRSVQKHDVGLTIRGLAGPFAVMAQNFAPGTTAADVESAMTPVGGEMVSCRIVKKAPFIIAEMVFVSREGGERVIETFNNKTADGRIIKVYPKPGGYQPEKGASTPPSASASPSHDQIVDGTLGFFGDLMNAGNAAGSRPNDNRLHYHNDKNGATNKRGRGFQTGRNGR